MTIKIAMLSIALGVAAIATSMSATARVYVDINVAPPAVREELVPAGRSGYVWAPGYWNWSGHKHVWSKGHYIREHRGHEWVGDRWEQRGEHWHHEGGHWN